MQILKLLVTLALAASVGLSLVGCGSAETNGTITKPMDHTKAIDAVKNNPNMPDAAKQQAIARLQQGANQGAYLKH